MKNTTKKLNPYVASTLYGALGGVSIYAWYRAIGLFWSLAQGDTSALTWLSTSAVIAAFTGIAFTPFIRSIIERYSAKTISKREMWCEIAVAVVAAALIFAVCGAVVSLIFLAF